LTAGTAAREPDDHLPFAIPVQPVPADREDVLEEVDPAALPAEDFPDALPADTFSGGRIVVHVRPGGVLAEVASPPPTGWCQFCGKRAWRSDHARCAAVHYEIMDLSVDVILCEGTRQAVQKRLERLISLAASRPAPIRVVQRGLVDGWGRALDLMTERDFLGVEDEENLVTFASTFGLSEEVLDARGAYSRAGLSCLLRDLRAGKRPSRVLVMGPLPFNLQKSEELF
jgi:hypothetical protein